MSDLFATAVHRFGKVWADLMVAAVAALAIASLPVVAVRATGGSAAPRRSWSRSSPTRSAYFCLLGYVMLRGLPERAPRRRVVWTYMTAVLIGILCGRAGAACSRPMRWS